MSARFSALIRRAIAVLIAVGVALGGAIALVEPASAATAGVKVAAVKTGNGTVVTPKVSTTGKAKVTKKSYKITKSGKTIATTSTSGKTIKVKAGTYKVKTTVKYKVGKKTKTYSRTATVNVKTWNPASMSKSEYDQIKSGMSYAEVKSIVGSGGTRTDYSEYEWDGETIIDTRYEWTVTGSQYGFAAVYFVNGVVDTGYYKYFSA